MKNKFFNLALRRAAKLVSKRAGLFVLLIQLSAKLKTVNWKSIHFPTVREKFYTLGRFVKAYAMGHYRDVSWKAMITIVAAVVYFVSPIDLIPDFIPVTGLTDDLGILLGVFNSLDKEIERFLTWEKTTSVKFS